MHWENFSTFVAANGSQMSNTVHWENRESGANPGQYLLLWVPFQKEFEFTELFATGVERWEGSVKGTSQKTCHFALKILYLQATGKDQNSFYPY